MTAGELDRLVGEFAQHLHVVAVDDLVERETFDVDDGGWDGLGFLCCGELQQPRAADLDTICPLLRCPDVLDVLGDGFLGDVGELLGPLCVMSLNANVFQR